MLGRVSYGISVEDNDARNSITRIIGNTVDTDFTSDNADSSAIVSYNYWGAINLRNIGSVRIQDNTSNLISGRYSFRNAYANQLVLRDNFSNVSTDFGVTGSSFSIIEGDDVRVLCNVADGLPGFDITNIYFSGLEVQGTSNGIYRINSMTNTTVGMEYRQDLGGTNVISQNKMFAPMNTGLYYNNVTNVGAQNNRGNRWFGPNLGAQYGGYLTGNDYLVPPSGNENPGSFSPPNWFDESGSTRTELFCQTSSSAATMPPPTVSQYDEAIMGKRVSLQEGLLWEGAFSLYKKLSKNPLLLSQHLNAQKWKKSMNNKSIGEQYHFETLIQNISEYPVGLKADYDKIQTEIEKLQGEIKTLKDKLYLTPNNAALHVALLRKTNDLSIQYKALSISLNQIKSEINTRLQGRVSQNNALKSAIKQAENDNFVRDIYLKYVLSAQKAPLSKLIDLHNLGIKCPSEEGKAVYAARTLFSILTGGQMLQEIVDCLPAKKRESAPEVLDDLEVLVYPNPSVGEFSFVSTQFGTIRVEIFNALGTLVYQEGRDFGDRFDLSLNDLSSGIYRVILHNDIGERRETTVSIIK